MSLSNPILETALALHEVGLTPLPCHENSKRPISDEKWQLTTWNDVSDIEAAFPAPNLNLGLLVPDDVAVIDVDAPKIATETTVLEILKLCGIDTSHAFGRAKKPYGAFIVKTDKGIKKYTLNNPDGSGTIIEVLQHRKNKLLPPSSFGGESFTWQTKPTYDFKTVPFSKIKRACNMTAVLAVLMCKQMQEKGLRDHLHQALVHLFVEIDAGAKFTTKFLNIVAAANGDTDRADKDWSDQYADHDPKYKSTTIFREKFDFFSEKQLSFVLKMLGISETQELSVSQFGENMHYAEDIDPANITPLEFTMSNLAIKGELTQIHSTGGVGKSVLGIQIGLLSSVKDYQLATDYVSLGNYRTYYLTNEDSPNIVDARTYAIKSYLIKKKMPLPVRKFATESFKSSAVKFVDKDTNGRLIVNKSTVDNLKTILIENEFDQLIVDPLITFHNCDENQNKDMDTVYRLLAEIALECNVAVIVIHHTNKSSSAESGELEINANAARGAGSGLAAVRIAKRMQHMSVKDLRKMLNKKESKLTPEEKAMRYEYVHLVDAKSNYTGITDGQWFRKVKVPFQCDAGLQQTFTSIFLDHATDLEEKFEAESKKEFKEKIDELKLLTHVLRVYGFVEENDVYPLHISCAKIFKELMRWTSLDTTDKYDKYMERVLSAQSTKASADANGKMPKMSDLSKVKSEFFINRLEKLFTQQLQVPEGAALANKYVQFVRDNSKAKGKTNRFLKISVEPSDLNAQFEEDSDED